MEILGCPSKIQNTDKRNPKHPFFEIVCSQISQRIRDFTQQQQVNVLKLIKWWTFHLFSLSTFNSFDQPISHVSYCKGAHSKCAVVRKCRSTDVLGWYSSRQCLDCNKIPSKQVILCRKVVSDDSQSITFKPIFFSWHSENVRLSRVTLNVLVKRACPRK